MDGIVDVVERLTWECPSCISPNISDYVYKEVGEMTVEEHLELLDVVQDEDIEVLAIFPNSVVCENCGKEFETNYPELEEDEENES